MTYLPSTAHSLDGELSRLRLENQMLGEELAQCQADKEFVWSLWKRLQVASPDITQAIGIVVQREREKAERKDHKVLDILASKDDKIEELQKIIATQSKEMSSLLEKKLEISESVSRLTAENEEFKALHVQLQHKVGEFETRSKEFQEKEDMARTLSHKEEEICTLRKDKEDLHAIRDTQRQRIQVLEDNIQEERQAYAKLTLELSELKGSSRMAADMERELRHKTQEMEVVRKELSELWESHRQLTDHSSQQAHLIQQLRSLQTDTQTMLKNQEDAFTMESSSIQALYVDLKKCYTSQLTSEKTLKAELLSYKQKLGEQDSYLAELKRQIQEGHNKSVSTQASLDDKEVQAFEPEAQIEYRLHSMQSDIDTLKDRIRQKDRVIHHLEDVPSPPSSPLPRPRDSSTPGCSTRSRRSHSASPSRAGDTHALSKRLHHTECKLEDTMTLLRHKCAELEEVRGAHNRRLERLKSLQTNYRLCRRQLKTMEEEVNGPVKKKKKLKRSNPKALQKEDSDAVWNELAYFKTEHKNLFVENVNIQEELDTLRVQAAQDAATVHELRTCLEQEKEELAFLLEQQQQQHSTSLDPDPGPHLEEVMAEADAARNEAASNRRMLDDAKARLQKLDEARNKAFRDRDALSEERRGLKNEVNGLRQEVAERRMEITDLKRDLLRMQREMKKRKKKEKARPTVSKQYQRVLNRSIQSMSGMFDEFDKDGWEELTETSFTPDLSNATGTTDSLGEAISQTAKVNSPERRQQESVNHHVHRMGSRHESPVRDHPARRVQSPVRDHPARRVQSPVRDLPARRDVALSPIMVAQSSDPSNPGHGSLHVVSKKTVTSPAGRQLTTLRKRISSLQKEVAILKEAKQFAVKRETEQRHALQQSQADLQLANQRMATARASVQRLTGDVERLRAVKDSLETQIDTASVETSAHPVCTEQEWISLQARLKASTTELSKQLSQVKDLKAENSSQAEKMETVQSKLNHTERDLSQKRLLVDDLRLKLKIAQENAQTDTEVMVEAEDKLKQLAETNSRFKTQMESTRQRIAAVSREKLENEDKVMRLSEELEKKSKLALSLQRKSREGEAALARLEKTAEQQLVRLASQSEVAMETAQTQLKASTAKLQEFNKFVKILAHALINSIQQAQVFVRLQQRKSEGPQSRPAQLDPSVAQAHKVAADILNLSQSDLEDLLSGKGSPEVTKDEGSRQQETENKKNKKWFKKWEKVLSSKKEFGMHLVEMFMQKVEERIQLAATLGAI